MENIILTVLAILSFVYCCDFPVLPGWEFLVNQKDSIWFAIGCSIDAAYIFYVIQVLLPQKINEKKAYSVLERRIGELLDLMYELFRYTIDVCTLDTEQARFTISSVYVIRIEDGKQNPWIEKFDPENIKNTIDLKKKKILEDHSYWTLSKKILVSIQPLMDSKFPDDFALHLKDSRIIHLEMIQEYEQFGKDLTAARKTLKITKSLELHPFTNLIKIQEFEAKLADVGNVSLQTIPFMKISDEELKSQLDLNQ